MVTTCNERRVCFLNSNPFVVRTYGNDSFEIMQAARILLDGLLMDNVAEKLKCKHEWLKIWTVRRMKKTIAVFQTDSGEPSNSNRTGTILICACCRYLAFPRIYLIRGSDLAQRPRPLFRLVSHSRGDILLDKFPCCLVSLTRRRLQSEYSFIKIHSSREDQ